jgi:hypothetical protein
MSMTPALPQKINQSAESIENNLSFKWNICTAGNATVHKITWTDVWSLKVDILIWH